ncbi:hypothetical protein QZM76_26185, partial [Burkholderia multivorans]|nr:hypothetical protein [Burkholderia multivorans]
MSEVTVSPLPDRLRDRVAPTRASPLARRQARTRTARGVRRRASARTADAPLGLGLSVLRRILDARDVELHAGRVELRLGETEL